MLLKFWCCHGIETKEGGGEGEAIRERQEGREGGREGREGREGRKEANKGTRMRGMI